jgi:DNA-binding transcriptional LysR family regulator
LYEFKGLAMTSNHRYKRLQLVQLRSFCLAATYENFTAAAEALGLSKATVWQQVRALERRLGAVFLRRRGRSVELTPEGRLLLDMVQPHVNGLDSLESCFAARRPDLPQQVTVATIPYLISYHLPRPIRAFTRAHPSVYLNFSVESWRDAVRLVDQGDADLGVVPYPRDDPPSRNLEYLPLFDLQFYLMTARGHPLTKKPRPDLDDVLRFPLIQPQESSFTHSAVEQLLRKRAVNESVRWVMVSRSVDMTRKFVALGVGVALAYLGRDAQRLMPDVHMRLFDPAIENVPVALVVRKFAHLSAPAQAFQRAVLRACAEKK